MTPEEYAEVNLIGTERIPNRGVEGNQALVQALGDKLREIVDENAEAQNNNNAEIKASTYTRQEIDEKDAAVLRSANAYSDAQIFNFSQSAIYDVLYFDPLDGIKKKLQEILHNIAGYQVPGYTWAFLDFKDNTFQEWDDLDLTWAEFDGGGF